MHDLRLALRQLRNHPGFTTVALLSLALGIGANTALFSVVYAVLINPYPYAKPQEIWTPGISSPSGNQQMRAYRINEYLEMAKLPGFQEVMATRPGNVLLTGEFSPESLQGIRVSGNAFEFLGVQPVVGRTIQPSDIRPSGEAEPAVVLSFQLWQRLFGGDPNAIGKILRLDDQPHTIVGVMPPRFGWWTSSGLWLPLSIDRADQRIVFPIARLKPGTSAPIAGQQLHVLHLQLARERPGSFPQEGFTTSLTNYLDITAASGTLQRSLILMFGAVVFLLLIACANVANLQLARASSRAREIATRLSLGASRGRLIRQLLSESVLLSILGGALGLLFAVWMTRTMVGLMPDFYVPNEARIEVNPYVLLFCLLVSVGTGILFGLAPAFHSSRPDLTEALKDSTRGAGMSIQSGRTRATLVVIEVALSVVLLVSAGLTIRSFIALQQVDLGFRPDRVLLVSLPLPPKRYATLDQRNRFAQELLDGARSLPGVVAAAVGNGGLPFGGPQSAYTIEGAPAPASRRITLHLASSGYIETLGIPLRRGRMLTERDVTAMDRVAVLNEAAAKLWPPGSDPLGRQMRLEFLEKPTGSELLRATGSAPYVTIVGIVGDTRNSGLRNETEPVVILPYTLIAPPQRVLAVRAQGDPKLLLKPLREIVREMDKEQPLARPLTLQEVLASQKMQPRFTMALFTLFGCLGLVLTVAGIYSVLSYHVTRKTSEIGVRMALGAQRGDILRLVFQAGGGLVGLGLLVGLLASFGTARLLWSRLELFQVTAADPWAFLGVVMVLSVIAMFACYVPARRAAGVEPMEALRHE